MYADGFMIIVLFVAKHFSQNELWHNLKDRKNGAQNVVVICSTKAKTWNHERTFSDAKTDTVM